VTRRLPQLLRPCVVALAGLLAGASGAAAQNIPVMVMGGLNVARLALPLDTFPADILPVEGVTLKNGSRIGLLGGVALTAVERGRNAVEVGALISARGGSVRVDIPGLGSADVQFRFLFLDIPALGRFEIIKLRNGRVLILAGATTGVKLSAKLRATASGQPAQTEDFGSEVTAADIGATFGARVVQKRWLVDVRYTHGLTNLAKDSAEGESVKSRVLALMAGWIF
jgi:outer membrane protein with beta-barrel domain